MRIDADAATQLRAGFNRKEEESRMRKGKKQQPPWPMFNFVINAFRLVVALIQDC